MDRMSRDELFMRTAQLVAHRGTCTRADVGVVIVKQRRIVSMGYNGAPPGQPHCTEVGCDPPEGCERTVHAELNAILWAGRGGISCEGATMYSTHSPCRFCAQAILACGIEEFHYLHNYRAERLDILKNAGLEVIPFLNNAP